jgi:hypothetical protein
MKPKSIKIKTILKVQIFRFSENHVDKVLAGAIWRVSSVRLSRSFDTRGFVRRRPSAAQSVHASKSEI